jgi:hypothetical protein
MFQRAFSFFLLLIIATAMAIYWFNVNIQPEDIAHYEKLTAESIELRSHHALERQPAKQLRENVQKDIWVDQGKTHYRIKSAHSELVLFQTGDKVGALENLEEIDGSLVDPHQTKTFAAIRGTYHFPTHQFSVESAQFAFFKNQLLNGAAVADRVTYVPSDKTLHLFMNPPRRVLFWQEGMRLSAPEIVIHQGPETKKEAIEGIGDVHFSFDLEEQNFLDQLFQKYL